MPRKPGPKTVVKRWLKQNKGATMEEAFKATGVSKGQYRSAGGRMPASEERGKALAPVTYEQEALAAVPMQPQVRPGMVALVGSPEDLSRFLATLGGGR